MDGHRLYGWLAGNTANVIVKVTPDGIETAVAGALDQLTVAGSTSVVFGKGKDSRTLYATLADRRLRSTGLLHREASWLRLRCMPCKSIPDWPRGFTILQQGE
jgi:hypothetical protein